MIIGGELSKDRIKFVINRRYSPILLRGIFTGHADFFTIPPFDEKINSIMADDTITFLKPTGKPFVYEEMTGIIKKISSFSKITTEEARNLTVSAREILPSRITYFFPDIHNPYMEIGFYYNWVRIDFYSYKFPEFVDKLKKTLNDALDRNFKIFSNNMDDISIYNWDDSCIFISRSYFRVIGKVLKGFDFLSAAHQKIFSEELVDFAVKVYAFTEANDTYRKIRSVISDKSDESLNRSLQYFLEILSDLAKRGRIYELGPHQQRFLEVMRDNQDRVPEFCQVPAIIDGIRNVATKLSEEIELAKRIRPLGPEAGGPDFWFKKPEEKKSGKPEKPKKVTRVAILNYKKD